MAKNSLETGSFHNKTAVIKHTKPQMLSSFLQTLKRQDKILSLNFKLLWLCLTRRINSLLWFQMLICFGLLKSCMIDHLDHQE